MMAGQIAPVAGITGEASVARHAAGNTLHSNTGRRKKHPTRTSAVGILCVTHGQETTESAVCRYVAGHDDDCDRRSFAALVEGYKRQETHHCTPLTPTLPPFHLPPRTHFAQMQAIRLQKKHPEISQDEMFDLINRFK